MCTVTFIPTRNGTFLSSNRDEKKSRKTAFIPESHCVNGYDLLYPTDKDAGGSWIAVKNNGDAAVLLNGAFVNHIPLNTYRTSRGIVFVQLISSGKPVKYFYAADFSGIAPFTAILYINRSLIECRWDGRRKYAVRLNAKLPYIWSSVTLYDAGIRKKREEWFKQCIKNTCCINPEAIFHFHRFGGNGDKENDLVINRWEKLLTVSITSVHIQNDSASMNYFDMKINKAFTASMPIQKKHLREPDPSFFDRLLYRIKKATIISTHWEYWPFHIVYGPLYLYWLYLSLKARSFFFFSEANPLIENAGFTNERKSSIYAMMPKQHYPKTAFCKKGILSNEIRSLMQKQSLGYPLIAKPDIGERGALVKLIHNAQEMEEYARMIRVDFLLQEFISYEAEVGIFYYRIPGEKAGKISGIVGKEFLSVKGNGKDTVEKLISKNQRAFLQLPALRNEYRNFLHSVLPDGDIQELVPYGNHARGARFVDLSEKITEELTVTIDRLCQQVPEFYFGRLDIRYGNWEDLCQGKHFSVIELNGAGSEPSHIYDPSHSLFYAWKEIIWHWQLLYKISSMNARINGSRFMKTGTGMQMLKDHSNYMNLLTLTGQ